MKPEKLKDKDDQEQKANKENFTGGEAPVKDNGDNFVEVYDSATLTKIATNSWIALT
tara:strand:- start:41 stop:211 length:171 start_codon:yes stop_codon:yes gene_type:complete